MILRFRDALDVFARAYASPANAENRVFSSERFFVGGERVFHALHSSLWYELQEARIPENAVLAPFSIASDKMLLSQV